MQLQGIYYARMRFCGSSFCHPNAGSDLCTRLCLPASSRRRRKSTSTRPCARGHTSAFAMRRALVVRLSRQGLRAGEIIRGLGCSAGTVRNGLRAFNKCGAPASLEPKRVARTEEIRPEEIRALLREARARAFPGDCAPESAQLRQGALDVESRSARGGGLRGEADRAAGFPRDGASGAPGAWVPLEAR